MLSKIKENLLEKELISIHDRILCSVSGGKDSMAMVYVLKQLGFQVGIAHINHNTRNGESDLDELFVEKYARAYKIPFFSAQFNFDGRGNFQNKARDFRYHFLNEVAEEHNYNWIMTGHHSDDSEESFFLNVIRGTGIKGLLGIPKRNEKIIRPLHQITRHEIDCYVEKNDVQFREDSSNSDISYQRNKVRHLLFPVLKKIHPRYSHGILTTIDNLNKTNKLLEELTQKYLTHSYYNNPQVLKNSIKGFHNINALLFQLFSSYGFNQYQINDLTTSDLGGKVESNDRILVNDRMAFTLMPNEVESIHIEIAEEGEYQISNGRSIRISVNNEGDGMPFKEWPFPFVIRGRQDGDKFKPDGMSGKTKSLKKYLTDIKMPFEDKQYLLLVEKAFEIKGLIGGRNAYFDESPSHYIKIDCI